ncbi:MAG: DUF296 domain-containing protein [Proteobacteria bacterium]|nr:DUF296 domain-containing protein [Pseudomonadota bacterium]MBS0508598.1 DUF296 domain-containing protein [Pseudomonadota bacterium]
MHANPSTYPRARTLVHPGPFNPVRIQSRHSASAQHFRLQIQPGASLFDALVQPLAERGIHSASTTILGGLFERLQFCMAPPDPLGQAIIRYTSPVDTGRTYMVFGNATIGKNQDGHPIVHCHAAIRTESGEVKGGHIITQAAIAAEPLSVLVTSLDGFELRVAYDPETNIPLIQPLDSTSGETS